MGASPAYSACIQRRPANRFVLAPSNSVSTGPRSAGDWGEYVSTLRNVESKTFGERATGPTPSRRFRLRLETGGIT